MALKWFIQNGDSVDGPLSTEDVQSRLQSGQALASHLVWGAGMDQWRPLSWWAQEHHRLHLHKGGASSTPSAEAPTEAWHYALGGKSHGPFTRDALLKTLKSVDSLGEVLLWTKGMKEWAPVFEFHDVLTALGVNKRQFPRADLAGKAVMKLMGSTLVAPLLTISEGGFGVQLDSGLTAGESMSVELHSPSFPAPLLARAEVRYVSEGIVGIRFTNVQPEVRSAIVQFVRQSTTRFVLRAS